MPTAAGVPSWSAAITPPPRGKVICATPAPVSPPRLRAVSSAGRSASSTGKFGASRPSPPRGLQNGYPARRGGVVDLYQQHQQQQKIQQQQCRRRPSSAAACSRNVRYSNRSVSSSYTEDYVNDQREDYHQEMLALAPSRDALEDENLALRALADQLRQQLTVTEERELEYQTVVAEWLNVGDSVTDVRRGPGDCRSTRPPPSQPRLAMFRQAADGGDMHQWNR